MSSLVTPPLGLPILLGVQRKPTIIGVRALTSTTSPLTLDLFRRERDILLIAFVNSNSGGSPGLPSGWTSLANSAVVNPQYRVFYKFCDGSEAPTTTSSVSAGGGAGVLVAVKGALRVHLPTLGGGTTATSSTPNPGNFNTAGFTGRNVLYLPWCMWDGAGSCVGFPTGYTQWPVQAVHSGCGVAAIGRHSAVLSEDASAFTLSASLVNRAGTVAVSGL